MRATLIKDETTLDQLVASLSNGTKYVSYDIEVQNDEKGKMSNLEDWHPSSRVVSASFTFEYHYTRPPATCVVPLSHPAGPFSGDWRGVLTRLAEAMGKAKIIGHNLKFDLRWTHSMTGVALEDRAWFDTMAAAHLLDENERKSLKEVAPRMLGVKRWDDVDLGDSERVQLRDLLKYNALDTLYTWRLVEPMMAELKQDKRIARIFHYVMMPIIRSLIVVERNGLRPDGDEMMLVEANSTEQMEVAERNLLAYAQRFLGDDFDEAEVNWSPSSKFFRVFMDRSGAPVYKHSPKTGKPSWDKSVLDRLSDEGAEYAKHLLAFREHQKTLGFIESWRNYSKFDGRIHPSFNPFRGVDDFGGESGTVTGRLSSSNPNAQQIPRKLKRVFAPDNRDWVFVEADFSQIELRLGAEVFNEPNMLQAYLDGKDLHTEFAARMTNKDASDVLPQERQHAKAGNFGFLYGMSAQGFVGYAKAAYGVDVELGEAEAVRRAFFKTWSGLEEGHERIIDRARQRGIVFSPLGRPRRVPDIHSDNGYERGRAERQAINSVVQSFASDLMLLTIIDLREALDPEEAIIVGSVHDSILLEVRKDVARDILQLVGHTMLYPDIQRRFGTTLRVPLAVEFKVGRRWADDRAKTIELSNA